MGIQDREYYRDDEPGIRLGGSRMMVTNILIVTIAIFVIDAFTNRTVFGTHWLAYNLSLKADLFQKPWNFWQLLTCGFAHSSIDSNLGIRHIGLNMLMLWIFGYDIERRYGRTEFLRFYLVAILASSVCWLGIEMATGTGGAGPVVPYMLGASGAVTAVLILYVFTWPKRTLLLMGIVPIPAWLVGVLCVASDMMGQMHGASSVAYTAHLGGAAFASMYFLLHWNLGRVVPDKWFQLDQVFRRKGPSLKVHDPERFYQDRDQEADRVLEKLHTQGEASLTAKERRILEDYSRRMRQKHR